MRFQRKLVKIFFGNRCNNGHKKKRNAENDYRYIEILILVPKNRKYAEWIWFLFCKLTSSSPSGYVAYEYQP